MISRRFDRPRSQTFTSSAKLLGPEQLTSNWSPDSWFAFKETGAQTENTARCISDNNSSGLHQRRARKEPQTTRNSLTPLRTVPEDVHAISVEPLKRICRTIRRAGVGFFSLARRTKGRFTLQLQSYKWSEQNEQTGPVLLAECLLMRGQ